MTKDPETIHGDLEGQSCRLWEVALVALWAIALYLWAHFRRGK